jgi:hypothetical protein
VGQSVGTKSASNKGKPLPLLITAIIESEKRGGFRALDKQGGKEVGYPYRKEK